jgi:hypothetical protein
MLRKNNAIQMVCGLSKSARNKNVGSEKVKRIMMRKVNLFLHVKVMTDKRKTKTIMI